MVRHNSREGHILFARRILHNLYGSARSMSSVEFARFRRDISLPLDDWIKAFEHSLILHDSSILLVSSNQTLLDSSHKSFSAAKSENRF